MKAFFQTFKGAYCALALTPLSGTSGYSARIINAGLIQNQGIELTLNATPVRARNFSWDIGNIVIQHTAKNQFVNEDRYLWGELNSIWNNVYDNMRDINNICIPRVSVRSTNSAPVKRCWIR